MSLGAHTCYVPCLPLGIDLLLLLHLDGPLRPARFSGWCMAAPQAHFRRCRQVPATLLGTGPDVRSAYRGPCLWQPVRYWATAQGSQLSTSSQGSHAAAAAAKLLQSCPTLCGPIDGSPPGSPVPGILQARTLEWVAISFSNAWNWKVNVKSLSCMAHRSALLPALHPSLRPPWLVYSSP